MKTFRHINRFRGVGLRSAVCILGVIFATNAVAGQITLAWDPNPEDDVVGYRLHYGTTSRSYSAHIDVGNVTLYTLTGLKAEQTYYFAASAYDGFGNESGYSNEISYTVPAAKILPWLQLLLLE